MLMSLSCHYLFYSLFSLKLSPFTPPERFSDVTIVIDILYDEDNIVL